MRFSVQTNIRPGFGQRLEQYLVRQLKQVTDEGKATLETVTDGWENRPRFRSSTEQRGQKVTMSVTTDSDIFNWVDKGTQPHRIPRAGRSFMAFQGEYRPRTSPGRLQFNFGGGVSGGPTVFAQVVQHPGIEARNFTARVASQMKSQAGRILANSFRRRLPL